MSNIDDTIYRVAHGYPGGIPALAARMGMNPGVLQNKVNPNCSTHKTSAEEAAVIADVTDADDIARAFAARRHMICVHLAQFDDISDQALLDLFLTLEKEQGNWSETIQKALADGTIYADEFAKIKKEFDEYCAAGAEVMSRLQSLVRERRVTLVRSSKEA